MAKKAVTNVEDSGTDVREELTTPNEVPVLADDVTTLEFKQNAYWLGTLRMAGEKLDFTRDQAQELLRTTGLFIVA